MKKKALISIFSIGAILLLVNSILYGELKVLNEKLIAGLWVAEHDLGREELLINSDGTYHLTFFSAENGRFENHNTWTIEAFNDGTEVIMFKNFSFGKEGYSSCSIENAPCLGNQFWLAWVCRNGLGGYKIIIDPDIEYSYYKE